MKIINLIGNTPIVHLDKIKKTDVYVKLESFNPTGSMKDRIANAMINDAIENGYVSEGGTIIEATSGNTGIALSFVAKQFNLKAIIVMPENMSKERIDLMKTYGAKVILTKKENGMVGAVEKAKELNSKLDNSYYISQFTNKFNMIAHYNGTAREIFNEIPDLDVIVLGIGTGGSAMGIGKFIKDHSINCKLIAVEPEESMLFQKGIAGSHKIQGIGANFIPPLVDRSLISEFISVKSCDAIADTKILSEKYGLSSGISTGANFSATNKIIKNMKRKSKILFLSADSVIKYLSTNLYE